ISIIIIRKEAISSRKALLFLRTAYATGWTQPCDAVHHETIRLVSLKLRLRKRIAEVLCTNHLFIMCNARFSTLSAASLTASLKVGWEWQVTPICCGRPPYFIPEKSRATRSDARCC